MTASMQSKKKRSVCIFAMLAIVIFSAILLDHLVGYANETGRIREDARKFRAETAYLRTMTLNIVPSIDHAFPAGDRSPRGKIPQDELRKFRSGQDGSILSGRESPKADTRILFLGGSTTEANEVDEPYRFVAVVEEILRRAGLNIATINAGVRGHTTQDSINGLINRRGFREADIVVMLHNINDGLILALRGGYHADLGVDATTSAVAVKESASGFLHSIWDYVSYRSNMLFLIRSFVSNFDPWTGEAIHEKNEIEEIEVNGNAIDFGGKYAHENQPKFEENLRVFVGITRALGKRPVLMTQPLGVKSRSQEIFNDSIRVVAQQLQVPLIDLVHILPEDNSWAFLSDNIHLNNLGSQAIGQIVAREIAKLFETQIDTGPIDTGITRIEDLIAQCSLKNSGSRRGLIRRLIGTPGRYPSFSPDGRWLLFHIWEDGRNRIKVYNLKQGELFDLSPPESQVDERHPAFLTVQDQEFKIVFGQGFNEQRKSLERLMVRHWPSLKTEELIPDPSFGGAIAAVRNNQIVFAGFKEQKPDDIPKLFSIDTASGARTQLTNSLKEAWRPTIAPDGTIYFIANPEGDFDIYQLQQKAEQPTLFIRSDADEWDPAVSPDGRWIAFASKRAGSWDIYISPTNDPSKVHRISDLPGEEWDPSWHPSGDVLVFASKQTEESQIVGTCSAPSE
jgi:lysophospholipase L1-like esterase